MYVQFVSNLMRGVDFISFQLFMAGMWVLHEILVFFLFWNLPVLHLQEQLEAAQSRRDHSLFTATTIENTSEYPSLEQAIQPPSALEVSSTYLPGPSLVRRLARTGARTQSGLYTDSIACRVGANDDSAYLSSSNEFIEQAENYISSLRTLEGVRRSNATEGNSRDAQQRTSSPIMEDRLEEQRLTGGHGPRINSYGSVNEDFNASRHHASSGTSSLTASNATDEMRSNPSLPSVCVASDIATPDHSRPWRYYIHGAYIVYTIMFKYCKQILNIYFRYRQCVCRLSLLAYYTLRRAKRPLNHYIQCNSYVQIYYH